MPRRRPTPPRLPGLGPLRRRAAEDERVARTAKALEDGALRAENVMVLARRHSRLVLLGGLALVAVVLGLIVLTSGSGTVTVSSAEQAGGIATELRPGLRAVSCRKDQNAWECTGSRRDRPWTCRVFLQHAERQALTGSCARTTRAR